MIALIRENSFSLLTLILAAISAGVAFQYPADSSGFPRVIAILLMMVSSFDLFRGVFVQRKAARVSDTPKGSDTTDHRAYLMAAFVVLLSAPAYVVLARLFDFEIATFIYLFAGMVLLGMRRPFLIVSIAVGVLVAVKGLFFVLLDVTRTSTLIFGT